MTIERLFNLTGKVAIVTGGHSGIGQGLAEGLAEAGANLVIAGRRYEVCEEVSQEIASRYGVQSLAVRCDVTHNEDVDKLVEATLARFEKLDIMVNSAGISGSEKPITEISEGYWDRVLSVNLKGTFLCSRAAARTMIKQREGKIINVASMDAFITARNMADYSASKGGVLQLTRATALDLVKYNIQVNAICPGYFLTPMNLKFFTTEAGKKVIDQKIPMRRLGSVEELKGIAIYLASSASSFTTGAAIIVDGGQTIW